jgi:hypothetical protein
LNERVHIGGLKRFNLILLESLELKWSIVYGRFPTTA